MPTKKPKRRAPAPIVRYGRVTIWWDAYHRHQAGYIWRFRVNGRTIAISSDRYARRRDAVRAWQRFARYMKLRRYALDDPRLVREAA